MRESTAALGADPTDYTCMRDGEGTTVRSMTTDGTAASNLRLCQEDLQVRRKRKGVLQTIALHWDHNNGIETYFGH